MYMYMIYGGRESEEKRCLARIFVQNTRCAVFLAESRLFEPGVIPTGIVILPHCSARDYDEQRPLLGTTSCGAYASSRSLLWSSRATFGQHRRTNKTRDAAHEHAQRRPSLNRPRSCSRGGGS